MTKSGSRCRSISTRVRKTDVGDIIHVVNFIKKASFSAIVLPDCDPTDGFSFAIDPADPIASPKGWHYIAEDHDSFTTGNNIDLYVPIAIENSTDFYIYRPNGGPDQKFDSVSWLDDHPPEKLINMEVSAVHRSKLSHTYSTLLTGCTI
jgi:hypothetical protein